MSFPVYLWLEVGAVTRLRQLRALAKSTMKKSWREARSCGFDNAHQHFGALSASGDGNWYTHNGEEFRNEQDAQNVVRLRHDGWYTDGECSESAVGIIARLPHGRFIAGYRYTMNGERFWFSDTYTDDEAAAHMADEHARIFAENCRDDDERFQAMTQAEGHEESVRYDVDMAFQARNVSTRHREHARERIQELRAARADVKRTTDAYNRGA